MDILNNFRIACCICIVGLFLASCEEVLDVELPYEQRVVLNHFVLLADGIAAADTQSVRNQFELTRTINVNGDDSELNVRDASVILTSKRGSVIANQKEPGRYEYNPHQIAGYGDSVSITVRSGEMTATSATFIPKPPRLDTATSYVQRAGQEGFGEYVYHIEIIPDSNTVYYIFSGGRFNPEEGVAYLLPGNVYMYGDDKPKQTANGNVLLVGSTYTGTDADSINIRVYAVDKTYQRFLDSRFGNNDISFGFGGTNPYFNVKGAGIGAFYGMTTKRFTLKLR